MTTPLQSEASELTHYSNIRFSVLGCLGHSMEDPCKKCGSTEIACILGDCNGCSNKLFSGCSAHDFMNPCNDCKSTCVCIQGVCKECSNTTVPGCFMHSIMNPCTCCGSTSFCISQKCSACSNLYAHSP